jgi:hypothetical protein
MTEEEKKNNCKVDYCKALEDGNLDNLLTITLTHVNNKRIFTENEQYRYDEKNYMEIPGCGCGSAYFYLVRCIVDDVETGYWLEEEMIVETRKLISPVNIDIYSKVQFGLQQTNRSVFQSIDFGTQRWKRKNSSSGV